jgi:putative tricarboxylic transport membrane protein
MNETAPETGTGPSQRSVEIGVAVLMLAFAMLVMAGSWQVGIGWGVEGPRAGFFPFYVGLLIFLASAVNLFHAFTDGGRRLFASYGQLGQVFSVIVPTAIYVSVMPWLGLYVSSFLLIAVFMRWLGGYRWLTVAAVSIAVPLLAFFMFERWFLVPLPKGPLEDFLGF